MKKITPYIPHILLGIYLIIFICLGINPYERSTWFVENLPIVIVVLGLVLTFKKFRFSNFSYVLMFSFLIFHTIGGHYTFERVPFDFINDMFGWKRNSFDRVGHFLVGVFAYPIAELFYRKNWVKNIWVAILVGILALGFWGALYEIIEMIYAVKVGGSSGASFLGSQGDVWDAQKDMALDILGAGLFSFFYLFKKHH
ncbi:DUF2238 domain-containing protein [Candidatus Parcubacteria bacterium]|nr:DUF2238 domain-containing protein [Candidatus Parcubacteria bacterium]